MAEQAIANERVRGDSLPEYTRYQDRGCQDYPSCLTCPLPCCRYDKLGGVRAIQNVERDQQIRELRDSGSSIEELSGRFRISRRSIFRILAIRSLVITGPAHSIAAPA